MTTSMTYISAEGVGLRVCAGLQHDTNASVPLHLKIRIRGNGVSATNKAVGTSSDGSAASLGSGRERTPANQPHDGTAIASSEDDRNLQHVVSGQSLEAQEAVPLSEARSSLVSNGHRVSQELAAAVGSRAHDAPQGQEARVIRRPQDRKQAFSLLGSWAPVVPQALNRSGRAIPEKPSTAMLAYTAAPAQPPPAGMTCQAWLLSADQRR